MKEIVFSESAKASMKFAQRYDAEQMLRDGPTAVIGKCPSQEELRRMWAGEPLGGNPQDVLGLEFCLDMGDVSGDIAGPRRAEELRRLRFWAEDSILESSAKDLETAKAAARNGEKIRIWVSNAPASACGLRHLLWEIRDCDCPVSVVELPGLRENGDGTVTHYTDWNEVQPGHFARFLQLERELGSVERRVLAFEWIEAQKENAPLRALVNGRLLGVPEDFYDHLLRRCMPDGLFRVGRLIGDVLGRYSLGVDDGWYYLRLQAMVKNGELKVVDSGDGDHPYSATLRRKER